MSAERSAIPWISGTLAKAGHRPEENEDAIAVAPERLRFAIADGATEGWESGRWARQLALSYARSGCSPVDFADWLAQARRGWRPRSVAGSAAWYAQEKQDQGSYATLLGVELRRPSENGQRWGWKAVAVGDSCLLHVRDGSVKLSFPLTGREQFGDRPPLVPCRAEAGCPEPEWLAGHAGPGDLLLLASDGVASQLFDFATLPTALEAARGALDARDKAPVLNWLRELQTRVNDDVSVIAILIPDAPEIP